MHQYSELSVGHVGRDCATLCGSVCRQCVERLRRELRNLLDLYRESDHALAPAHARLRQRVSGTRAVGTVLDERTVAMRTETAEVLASWARLVVEERGARGLRDCDVESLVEFLCGQLEWLAGHPAAVSFDDEVRGLLRRIGSALGPAPASGRPLGACVEPGCTGTLLAVVREAGEVSPGPDRVACDAGHTLPPRQWLAVAGRLARGSV